MSLQFAAKFSSCVSSWMVRGKRFETMETCGGRAGLERLGRLEHQPDIIYLYIWGEKHGAGNGMINKW